jgi:hypothetical protein
VIALIFEAMNQIIPMSVVAQIIPITWQLSIFEAMPVVAQIIPITRQLPTDNSSTSYRDHDAETT